MTKFICSPNSNTWYETVEELGKGTYGRVYKVKHCYAPTSHSQPSPSTTTSPSFSTIPSTHPPITLNQFIDQKYFVLKIVCLEGMSAEDREETLNEVKVMSQCEHFNIIKYYESFIAEGNLNIIMEYASGGDLGKKMKQQQGNFFKEDLLWNYLIQISQGLKYLHDKRILHRDLKPQNIFLDDEDNIKIGDMGLGKILGPQTNYAYTAVGTPLYFSPQLCEEIPYDNKSDIWAFGCLMYELACLRPPFVATNQLALAKKIVSEQPAPLPKHYSTEFQFLVLKMLEKDVAKRPDITNILNYSPVKLRLQKAKIRHREIRMKEQKFGIEQRIRHEYHEKYELQFRELQKRELLIESKEKQLEQEKKIFEAKLKDLEKREAHLVEFHNFLKEKENYLEKFASQTSSPFQQHLSPPSTHKYTPSPTQQNYLVTKPFKDSELENKFQNFFHDVTNQLKSPRRPRSAPSTPLKAFKNEVPILNLKQKLTPSPLHPSSTLNTSRSSLGGNGFYTNRSGAAFSPNYKKFRSHFVTPSELDLLIDDSQEQTKYNFEVLYIWKRQDSFYFVNDQKLPLSNEVGSCIIIYKATNSTTVRNNFQMEKISLYIKNELNVYVLPKLLEQRVTTFRFRSEHNQLYFIEIPASICRGKLLTHMKLNFSHPEYIEEVIVIRHDTSFLEIATMEQKELFHSPLVSNLLHSPQKTIFSHQRSPLTIGMEEQIRKQQKPQEPAIEIPVNRRNSTGSTNALPIPFEQRKINPKRQLFTEDDNEPLPQQQTNNSQTIQTSPIIIKLTSPASTNDQKDSPVKTKSPPNNNFRINSTQDLIPVSVLPHLDASLEDQDQQKKLKTKLDPELVQKLLQKIKGKEKPTINIFEQSTKK